MTKIVRSFYYYIKRILNTIYYLCRYRGHFILIDAWIDQWFGKLKCRNFGDELNVYLIENLTGKKVVNKRNTIFNGPCFLAIGSIVESSISSKSIIWGSGALYGCTKKKLTKPKYVLAVRGKYTRAFLLRNQIQCPEVYGDPALLLPYIYNKNMKKEYKYGLIPHIVDIDNPIIQSFIYRYKNDVLLISFQNYGNWQNVIDQIRSCEYIISSSLHGLIVSDAYNIPNVWIKVSEKVIGGEFKFKDYFSGVNREYKLPVTMTKNTELEEINNALLDYKEISPDLNSIINSCPWSITMGLN